MNAAASATMKEISDVILAYGISDEYRSSPLDLTITSRLTECIVLFLIVLQNCLTGEKCNATFSFTPLGYLSLPLTLSTARS